MLLLDKEQKTFKQVKGKTESRKETTMDLF